MDCTYDCLNSFSESLFDVIMDIWNLHGGKSFFSSTNLKFLAGNNSISCN